MSAELADITREQLGAELEEFRLAVRTPAGRQESGIVADPDDVAEVLHATLSRMAALREGPRGGLRAVSAELAARRTAAAAVLADYTREAATAGTADRALWAARLADALRYVLDELDAGDRAAARFPAAAVQLAEIRLVLDAFDWEGDRWRPVRRCSCGLEGSDRCGARTRPSSPGYSAPTPRSAPPVRRGRLTAAAAARPTAHSSAP